MQPLWKVRILEALEEALRVVATRGGGRTYTSNNKRKHGTIEESCISLSEPEREAVVNIVLYRVMLQMQTALRGHPNYRMACRVLEELPLWSLDRGIALEVVDALSSILGLPFRYYPGTIDQRALLSVRIAANQRIEEAKKLLGVNLIVK